VEPYPSTGIPILYQNPNAWNNVANMVFLEAPACVGFSYADDPSGCRNNDTQQAVDNFNALQVFYQGYPEYAQNDFYISGESYAGMYVPTLALQVLAWNNVSSPKIPLKGILVGNGVTGQNTGQPTERLQCDFLFGHGLYSNITYMKINADCGDFSNINAACAADLTQMSVEVGNVNIYDIYGDCISSGLTESTWRAPPSLIHEIMAKQQKPPGGPVACIDSGAAEAYLNQPSVRTAIHVMSEAQIGQWVMCTNKLIYTENWGSLLPNYKYQIIPFIRTLIFNGDADDCIPYNGNEWWTSNLGIPQTRGWLAWEVNGQVAGYCTKYQYGFEFVTVKGAGHMVPEYKPVQALAMFQRFLNNTCC